MKKILLFLVYLTLCFAVFAAESDVSPESSTIKAGSGSDGVYVSLSERVPYPEYFANLSREEKALSVLNALTAISTQKGLQYISRRAGYKPKTLFEDSYLISDLDDRKSRIEDPVFSELPSSGLVKAASDVASATDVASSAAVITEADISPFAVGAEPTFTLFAYQKDNRFGGNTYTVDYHIGSSFGLVIRNHTPIRFAGVTCVESGALEMSLSVTLDDKSGEFVIDGSAFIPGQKPKISFIFYTVDLESSFSRRVTALKNWFVERMQAER